MITEQLGSLGAWSVQLSDDTPRAVTDQLGFFGHVGVWQGRVDIDLTADATLLASARYVGVLREKPTGRTSLEGSGMLFWLGDEDGKGAVLENPIVFNANSLTSCVTALLPPAVTVGTIHDPGGTYTGKHQWQTPRAVLDTITAAFGVEYRVNGNGTIDVGTQAQLYPAPAQMPIISAKGAGNDFNLTSLGADFKTDTAVIDYTSRVVLLGQKTDDAGSSTPFVEATADAATFPYKDLHGNTVHITRTVSDSGQTDASAPAAAQLQLNQFNRTKTALQITATDYEVSGQPLVGQNAYVFDPDNGLIDPATQVDFRGELIFPQLIRISALQWPVTEGMTVAFRTQAGAWVDLTRWVVWETQSESITVGDLPRTLTSGSNPVLDQTQSAPDASVPSTPTGLALTTTSVQDSKGKSTATIRASWTAPALNTDGSVVTDLSNYLVQYRWQGRAPLWTTLPSPVATIDIPGLSVGLVYDVQVAAVDLAGHVSAFTAVSSITAAPDQTAPNPPSDPVVSSYLGQLRIAWDGKDNTGAAMPPDFAIVEVHVSATSGFTPIGGPGSTTLVSQLSTAGVAYATAPYGAARYVKLVSVDNSSNRSAPSGQVTGTTTQVADGDVASLSVGKLTAGIMSADVTVAGRFATALTGARVEMNSLGFQKFDVDGVTKLISLTGTEALLTGLYKSAASGRRIEIGAAGTTGELDFYAPDGTKTYVRAFTESTGVESIQLGMPAVGTTSSLWNKVHVNSDEWMQLSSNKVDLTFGKASGFFVVRHTTDKRQGTGNTIERLAIDGSNLTYWDGAGTARYQMTASGESIWDTAGNQRYSLADDRAQWYFPSGNSGGAIGFFAQPGINQFSPMLQMVVGVGYALAMRVINDTAYGGQLVEVEQWTQSAYAAIRASAFVVSSDEAKKTEIGDYDGDALAEIMGTRVRRYRRRRFTGDRMKVTDDRTASMELAERGKPGPVEIGLIAQEAPESITGGNKHVDVYQYAALLHRGVQQLTDRVAELEGKATA